MRSSGFVTDAAGMGHVAMTSKKPAQVRGFYNPVFDARLSDCAQETFAGVTLRARFLRVNERHHSIAIASVPLLPIDFIEPACSTSTSRSPKLPT
jgi:Glyoxalase/Bleomycin resistance protein/Dioxygenase superfamily